MHLGMEENKPSSLTAQSLGHSTLKGKVINNADLISRAGEQAGFKEVARLDRVLQSTKKSFNPTIGKIRTENILILENCAL